MSLVKHETEQVKTSEPIVLNGHKGPVLSAKFSPDGTNIVTSGADRQILLWNLHSEDANYGVLPGHKSGVTSVTWKLQSTLFSTSADSTVAFWDSETGQKLRKGVGHELTVNDSAASENGVYISAGDDGTLKTWDIREKSAVKTIRTQNPLICCALNAQGSVAYTAGIDPDIQAYDLRTGDVLWNYDAQSEGVTGLHLSADESMLVLKSVDGTVDTVSAKSFLPEGISRRGFAFEGAHGDLSQFASKVRFLRDDVYIGLGSEDGSLILWSSANQRMVSKMAGHEKAVVDVDFHPHANIVMSTSCAGDVIVREY